MAEISLPRLPTLETLNRPGKSVLTADGRALVAYDAETCSGFVYVIELERWNITAPIAFLDFAALLPQLGIGLTACQATRAWIDACSGIILSGCTDRWLVELTTRSRV